MFSRTMYADDFFLNSGEWVIFTGNQIGSILGAASFEKAIAAGKKPGKTYMLIPILQSLSRLQ